MVRKFRPHIPESLGELLDNLASMLLSSPTFIDRTGYFPEKNLETSFYALNEGLGRLRAELGEELYRKLTEMSGQMRAWFEADPADITGETRRQRNCSL
jgi:hypothetical protein